jgi:hypothetical protein
LLALVCWSLPGEAAPAPFARSHDRSAVKVRLEEVPWKRVRDWIGQQTGKPIVGSWPPPYLISLPAGCLTCDRSGKAQWPVPLVIELVRTAVRSRSGYVLIERERCFIVVMEDE